MFREEETGLLFDKGLLHGLENTKGERIEEEVAKEETKDVLKGRTTATVDEVDFVCIDEPNHQCSQSFPIKSFGSSDKKQGKKRTQEKQKKLPKKKKIASNENLNYIPLLSNEKNDETLYISANCKPLKVYDKTKNEFLVFNNCFMVLKDLITFNLPKYETLEVFLMNYNSKNSHEKKEITNHFHNGSINLEKVFEDLIKMKYIKNTHYFSLWVAIDKKMYMTPLITARMVVCFYRQYIGAQYQVKDLKDALKEINK